jgi:RNA polymerase sigma-70 factor, ECF subfamily
VATSFDDDLRALHGGGAFDEFARRALAEYGPELYGFLVHTMGGEAEATEVFSDFGENLWTALPGFEFRCSVRTWMYVLARHSAAHFRRTPWNQRQRRCGSSQLEGLMVDVRTRTQPWLSSQIKDRFRMLRDGLEPEDRELLVLRVDRDLAWEDVARVMLGEENSGAEAVRKESARLRKRYQFVKDDLRRRARDAGLLSE